MAVVVVVAALASVAMAGNLEIEQKLDDQVNVISLEQIKLTCRIKGAETFTWLYNDQPISTGETIEIKDTLVNYKKRLIFNF